MPVDEVYLPIHVGREGNDDLGYTGDNTGDNISVKNPNYCELTGLYWAWKNLYCEYIGLCHYRRYFAHKAKSNSLEDKKQSILTKKDYEQLLQQYDVILPKKRNYYIETVRSQYEHAHNKRDLDEVENIIRQQYPSYIEAFEKVMNSRKLYIYNMFVMDKFLFDKYCIWLFDILFTLEKRIDIANYDKYNARVFGFLSERLFNVWLEKQNLNIKTMNVVFLEKINWKKKIYNFIKRKYKK